MSEDSPTPNDEMIKALLRKRVPARHAALSKGASDASALSAVQVRLV